MNSPLITILIGRNIHAKRSFVHLIPKSSVRSILRKGPLILLAVSLPDTQRLFAVLHTSPLSATNTEHLLLSSQSIHIGLDPNIKALLAYNGETIQSMCFPPETINKFAAKFNSAPHKVSGSNVVPELYICTSTIGNK